ncbi:MAG: transposase [bacterium]
MLKRKTNRLPHQKLYHTNNSFFVTICVKDMVCCLSDIDADGKICDGKNDSGRINPSPTLLIVKQCWLGLIDTFNDVVLDEFVIMPNHFHGIITFLDEPTRAANGDKVDLSEIIRTFKAKTKKLINKNVGDGFILPHLSWQKSFYDHIIRGEKDLQRIQEYIINNPIKWNQDILHPKNKTKFQLWQQTQT